MVQVMLTSDADAVKHEETIRETSLETEHGAYTLYCSWIDIMPVDMYVHHPGFVEDGVELSTKVLPQDADCLLPYPSRCVLCPISSYLYGNRSADHILIIERYL